MSLSIKRRRRRVCKEANHIQVQVTAFKESNGIVKIVKIACSLTEIINQDIQYVTTITKQDDECQVHHHSRIALCAALTKTRYPVKAANSHP